MGLISKGKYGFKKTKGKIKCFKCNKEGHKSFKCPEKNKVDGKGDTLMASAHHVRVSRKVKSEWVVDSGATQHMSNEAGTFSNLDKNSCMDVHTASDECVKSQGTGDVKLKIDLNNNESNELTLTNTVFIPDFRTNLLSVPRITENDYEVLFRKHEAKIFRPDGTVAATASRENDLYIIQGESKRNNLGSQGIHSDGENMA